MLAGAGAVLVLLSAVLPLVLLDADGSVIDWLRDPEWQLLSAMALVLTWLMPFVMVAIYACQAPAAGALGLGGLAMAVIGLLAYSGFAFDMALVGVLLFGTALLKAHVFPRKAIVGAGVDWPGSLASRRSAAATGPRRRSGLTQGENA